ncbi:MAG: hypothetical protein WC565_05090 [Parcubacteria group bacterium]
MTLRTQLLSDLDAQLEVARAELARLQSLKRGQRPVLSLCEPSPRRPAADRTAEHTLLVNSACALLGNKRDLKIAKMSPAGEPTASGRPQHCGPAGLADICGILSPTGRIMMLEAKTGNARQSRVQIAMMRMVRGLGGFYSVFRTPADAEAAYERCKLGLNS